MASKAIIDNDILGWGNDRVNEIKEKYMEIISIGSVSELPPESKDEKIGGYCYENGCDLFTADKEAHTKFFRDARIKAVLITNYAVYETGNRPIYRIQIVKR